ncbi:MAG TPA: glucose-1-phosphate cytidylyltransferase [Nitrospira sp.]|nr:glucose-1-phosphate cytidylyltransferase [Nitrospira sp.]
MKVVLFCGGLGMRLREYSDSIPKPMVNIGYRPILWHLMKYYAHYGHKDFVLCLGYRGDVIKDYFRNYDECLSNNFTMSKGGREIQIAKTDIEDWTITFVETGLNANVGQRLKAVEPYLKGEEMFLANYTDGLTDCCLPDIIEDFRRQDAIGSFLSVRPIQSFHVVKVEESGNVLDIKDLNKTGLWINGGFLVLRSDIFRYIQAGEELVYEPFQRLIKERKLCSYRYEGFWISMDAFKDKQRLDDMYAKGETPWAVWS